MLFRLTRTRAASLAVCISLAAQGFSGAAFAQAAKQPAAPAAQGQQAQPQGPIKVDLQPSQADWTKVCGKDQGANKEICYTTRDFGSAPDQPPAIAVAVYDIKGDDTRIVRLLMPVGLLLKPGFRFSIDKGPQTDGAFEICMPNGCFAEAKVKGVLIDQLKKGTLLNVSVKNSVNNEVSFTIPLAGFGKAFDGAPIDPKVLEQQQQQLQQQLEAKAKQQRQLLEQQNGTAGAPATPAAPAAPAPAKK
ncbi:MULTISPECIES: invasion associated locus B family protein [Lichenihabitans]|uniref:invasion associated locus B family protein n=1 Tax=Lichenihabitans TaxID=2723776 RepID=UPI001036AE44|nr:MULTISPECIES: invasion associated locus B family protein [Lichenihabitans]UDL95181.1 invasion associated locus B family protein [Lichenihabitans sp. PAMC28606]